MIRLYAVLGSSAILLRSIRRRSPSDGVCRSLSSILKFFAWIFQFCGGVRIAGPENVRDAYRKLLLIGLGAQEIVHDWAENDSQFDDEKAHDADSDVDESSDTDEITTETAEEIETISPYENVVQDDEEVE